MHYHLKRCLKKEKYKKGELKLSHFEAMTIAEIKTNTLHGKPIVIPSHTILRKSYQIFEDNYHFEKVYYLRNDNSRNYFSDLERYDSFMVSEEEVNQKMIVVDADQFDLNNYIGVEIAKGPFSVYDSYYLFDKHKKKGEYRYRDGELDYAFYIDAPLKELFLYNRTISNFFIEKTVPILRDFVNAFTKASSLEQAKSCMKSMNEYLMTTLETVKDLSKKTEIEAIETIRRQTETEKFLENMKYRNEVAKQLQKC